MDLNANFFKNNRENLRKKLNLDSGDIVIVPANFKLQSNSDLSFPFIQDSNFFYLAGLNESDSLLIITAKHEWLFMPDNDEHQEQWSG
ncbi:aminopeptidase P N-terminal domain-containing protein, partial [Candidatus Saccharibacteria bacterium]|nr:aminopeptidase P N-terminal domain-containing protein [Candidatus Saccharibacteria bacterium]